MYNMENITIKDKDRRVIKVEVPKEIWDAENSFCNMFMNRNILGSWMESVKNVIKDCNSKNTKL